MAAARFWRLYGISTWGGGDLQASELHLHDASGRVDVPAALTCSHAPTAGALSDLRDATTATMCRFAGADVRSSGFWLQWDFGAGGERDIVAINLGSGASQATFPEAMTVASSSAAGGALSTAFTFEGIPYPGPQSMGLLQPANAAGGRWAQFGSSASTTDADALIWTCTHYSGSAARADKSVQSGKWYWELTVNVMDTSNSASGNGLNFGVWPVSRSINTYIYNTTGVYRAAQAAAPGDVFGIAFDADAGLLTVRRNNVVAGGALGQPLSMSEPWAPVIGDDNAGGALVRANFGASPFVFSPPSGYSPLVSGGSGVGARPVRTASSLAAIAASAPVAGAGASHAAPLATARDVEYGGQARIWGTTKIKGTPNVPTKARVVLLHQRSKLPVRETWSDPVTGYFEFRGIDTNQQFLALAEDAEGHFRPVAANRLTPEVLS